MDTDSLVIVLLLLICVSIILGYKVLTEWVSKKVFDYSNRIQNLVEINKKYDFKAGFSKGGSFTKSLPSKKAFDTYLLENLMREAIEANPEHYERIIENIRYNRGLYEKYLYDIDRIQTDEADKVKTASKIGIPLSLYQSIEDRLFEAWKLKPVREVNYYCEKRYTSPQGRNSYSRHAVYSYRDITRLYRVVQNGITTKSDAAYERAVMTPGLRYNILRRDRFRCQICGRSSKEDGVKLQVDHIKPVTKGGKTEPSNLRTLCEDCNRGKSNKYDPDGLN